MKNLKLGSFSYYASIYNDIVFVYIEKDKHVITTAKIENDKNLTKNIRFLLVNDFIYDKKYKIMEKIYKKYQYIDNSFDYGKAWDLAINTKEYQKLEKEKADLLKRY